MCPGPARCHGDAAYADAHTRRWAADVSGAWGGAERPHSGMIHRGGLLQSSVANHPLPDKEAEYSAPSPITSVEDSDSIFSGESKISEDTSSHLLLADIGHPWSATNSYTETRLSTACSSTFSWGNNEFENAASQQVQQMFFEIDELLFEEKRCSRVQRLEEECQEWKHSFPHFRILGTQIAAPVNEAYAWYPGPEEVRSPQPMSSPATGTATNELCLVGKSETFSGLPLWKGSNFMQKIGRFPWEEEGDESEDSVIIAEGFMEEYLALNYNDQEEDGSETRLDLSLQYEDRSGLPPISPSLCRRNTIVTELFDEVWIEVVMCMEVLIRKHWDAHVSDEDENVSSVEDAGFNSLNFLLPHEPQVQQTHFDMVQMRPKSLQIRGFPCNQRSSPMPEKIECFSNECMAREMLSAMDLSRRDPVERSVLRPYSSNNSASRFQSSHPEEHGICSVFRPVHSAQRRNTPRILHPIHSSPSRSRTPAGSINESIHGLRLQSARDCLSASTWSLRHNTLLPPIGCSDTQHSTAASPEPPQKTQIYSNQIQNAVMDEASLPPPKDRFLSNKFFTRPKSTHTFRL
ncbi:primary cilium assembly protein FAM149B1 isoform X2 [Amblyraja radiata]|uniref:primary cilium assembly protein FAM149B1 isoform X2 n=1 Tax=Amblyraja radiata TaxID=386614 RepID=UPI001403F702|nr:primary cilium assembly protein FAM149B1 isoform X2 [Amblyraja radiata]